MSVPSELSINTNIHRIVTFNSSDIILHLRQLHGRIFSSTDREIFPAILLFYNIFIIYSQLDMETGGKWIADNG